MVRRVINLMYKEVRGLHQAAYILACFAFGSQLLAVVRDRLLAHTFGAGGELDLYYTAFRIPDFLFVLFASVLSVYVLLPFVNRVTTKSGEVLGAAVISQVFTLFLITFTVVSAVIGITAPLYVAKLFPGFAGDYETLVSLLQILLLQAFLLGISNLCGVVTQAGHRFVLYAISPLLYNIGIIVGIVFLYPFFGLVGLVCGVVLGAVGHLLIQVPFVLRSKYRFSLTRHFDWSLIRSILKVAIPRGFTLSINQIVLLVLTGMATTMAVGSVSVFQFAFNLQSVPLAVIGMSYSVAAFPALSRLLAEGKQAEFNNQLLTALRHIVFWSVPVVGLVIVLRAQIVRVLLGSGAFDWADTRLTAAVLAIFVLSLVAQAILLLLIRSFYAGGRTMIPLIVSLGSALLSVGTALFLKHSYVTDASFQEFLQELFRLEQVTGAEVMILAVAFVTGQLVQMCVLMVISTRIFFISYAPLIRLFLQAVVAASVGAFSAYLGLNFLVDGINQETFIGIGLQGLVAGVIGLFMTGFAYWHLHSPEVLEIYRSFKTKIFKTDVVRPEPEHI
jgi:putative peptidoglycan lipid II flippase